MTKFAQRIFAAVLALAMAAAHATLVGRDIRGHAVGGSNVSAVFLYDTDLNITWLRDANVNGRTDWFAANAWAQGFGFGGYDDWRLPTTAVPVNGFNITSSEMGHLFYLELGSTARSNSRVGDFIDLQVPYGYWSGTRSGNGAWYFYTLNGAQIATNTFLWHAALAVRDGDVLNGQFPPSPNPVPSP